MSRVALWNVTIHGLLAVAMMGMAGSFPAQAGSKTVLQGKLVTCPDAAGMFCLQRADGKGTVTLLNVNEEAPMYFMRDLDTLTTMEIDVAVEGVLKSPTAYVANEGLTVRWGNKEAGLDAGSIHPSDDAADAGSVQETTLQELGGLLEANQARALMLYGGAPGFLLKGKALEFKVETNEKGEKLATVLIGPSNINSRSVDPTLGEKARILCYMDLASASQFKQGQVVTVSGVINDIRKIRYYYQFGEMWLTPFLVITYPCRLSPTP